MHRKKFWSIALALLLSAALFTGHQTLSAKATSEDNTAQGAGYTEVEKTEEEERTERQETSETIAGNEKEELPKSPEIGGGQAFQRNQLKGI